jgi:hypothetical protein
MSFGEAIQTVLTSTPTPPAAPLAARMLERGSGSMPFIVRFDVSPVRSKSNNAPRKWLERRSRRHSTVAISENREPGLAALT